MRKGTGYDFAKLNSTNYLTWKMRMEGELRLEGYHQLLERGLALETDSDEDKYQRTVGDDVRMQLLIIRMIEDEHLLEAYSANGGMACWRMLEKKNQQHVLATETTLNTELSNIRQGETETVIAYLERANQLQRTLELSGSGMMPRMLVSTVLRGVLPRHQLCVESLRMRDADRGQNVSLIELKPALMASEENWEAVHKTRAAEQAAEARALDVEKAQVAQAGGRWRQGTQGNALGRGGRYTDSFNAGRGQGSSGGRHGQPATWGGRGGRVCYACGNQGHIAKFCPLRRPQLQPAPGYNPMAYDEKANAADVGRDEWLIDSGASSHMTASSTKMTNYQQVSIPVKFAGGEIATAVGKGDVRVVTDSGDIILGGVLHVPGIMTNLLSVSKAVEDGWSVYFDGIGARFSAENKDVVCSAVRRGNLYWLEIVERANAASADESMRRAAMLWHRKLGHLSFGNLAEMQRKGMLHKCEVSSGQFVQVGSSTVCEACVLGKQSGESHPAAQNREEKPLGRVYCDVMGPVGMGSMKQGTYVVTLIDEATKYSVIDIVQQKSDASEFIKKTVGMLECQTGQKVKKIRTDRGGEFVNGELEAFYVEKGIVQETTAGYAPEQNGQAERLNRTLLDKVRPMLAAANLAEMYWDLAIDCANYLRNISVAKGVDKSPYTAMFGPGTASETRNLHVFGSLCWVMTPEEKRSSKISDRGRRGVFVGYVEPLGSKTYRVLVNGRLVESGDVRFAESGESMDLTDALESVSVPDAIPLPVNVLADANGGAKASQDVRVNVPAVGEQQTTLDMDVEVSKMNTDVEMQQPTGEDEDGMECEPTHRTVPGMEKQVDMQSSNRPHRERRHTVRFDPSAMAHHTAEVGTGTPLVGEPVHSFPDPPRSLEEALACEDSVQWCIAMDEEMKSQEEHKTWILEDLPQGTKALGTKWVFERKVNGRFKARLVAQGYSQKHGIDYEETFAPVNKGSTLRAFMSMVASEDLELCTLDIKTAFLNGDLEETVYVRQPQGYEKGGRKTVCKLKKALYGLKQSPRTWHKKLRAALLEAGLEISEGDPSLYILKDEGGRVLTVVHVDDCAIAGKTRDDVDRMVAVIQKYFSTRTVEEDPKLFVGYEISRDRPARSLKLSQSAYARRLVSDWQHELGERKTAHTPMCASVVLQGESEGDKPLENAAEYASLVGGLMWLANGTRPDIAYAVGVLARFSKTPQATHWNAALECLRYVKATIEMGLHYGAQEVVSGYCDADFARCKDSRRSTTGYVFVMNGAAITWQSKLQVTCAASTCEAEYQAASTAIREGLWLRKLLPDVGCAADTGIELQCSDKGEDTPPLRVRCDNQGALALIKNRMSTNRSKHIDIQHHFARERVESGEVLFEFCSTKDNKADCLTKPLAKTQLRMARAALGVR